MEQKRVNHLEQIPLEDWGKTPTSSKKLVEEMTQQIEQQENKLTEVLTVQEQLLEKINRTSKNSSSPPSRSNALGYSVDEAKHYIQNIQSANIWRRTSFYSQSEAGSVGC
ncbi:hypothetical protein [Anabaena catenula]|uniref:Uncharacterized protein n=1 Tax=Anabaena catenula FACHB-362 TaxID=2692877 RepID=A0ABR8J8J2_9NOST|nr:hypothetical protein [Anabaena catenula]MBD2693915.1 hypothetical protein [Anabaena catenula FACHB-362]